MSRWRLELEVGLQLERCATQGRSNDACVLTRVTLKVPTIRDSCGPPDTLYATCASGVASGSDLEL